MQGRYSVQLVSVEVAYANVCSDRMQCCIYVLPNTMDFSILRTSLTVQYVIVTTRYQCRTTYLLHSLLGTCVVNAVRH